MTKRTKLLIAGVGLLAAAALSLVRESHWPWSRDQGVGLRSTGPGHLRVLDLTKDAGNLSCWLRLRLPPGPAPRVMLDDVQMRVTPDGSWWRVTNPQPLNVPGPQPFTWYSGGHVYVHSTALRGWELYRDDGPVDSSTKELRRTIAFALSLFFYGVTTFVGLFTLFFPEPVSPAPRYSPDNCVSAIIETLSADPPEKTRRMQQLVVDFLQKKRYAKMKIQPSEIGLLIQGKRKLALKIEHLIERLSADLSRLD